MKVNIKKLPKGYSVVNGKIVNTMAMGGSSTGDQRNFGLVTMPPLPTSGYDDTQSNDVSGRIASSLPSIPREEANLEAEKGETVLTDMNNDGNFELYNIGGKRHHSGGTPLNLPPQSFIYSDTSKMKLDKYELAEMGITSKKKITPAKVSKAYELNKFIGILDDQHSDNITIDTAEYMLNKNKKSLSQLAFLQEAKKQFEDGVPLASYPYLTEKGINPLEFSQQVEQISAQEAEQKMMMQLPFEQRAQIMMAKEQQAQQQAAMQQQQMMAQQQQQMGAPQGMAQQQQMAPPQGMMPPQPPMQQPMAMGKRGGQMSNLYKAQMGKDFMFDLPPAVQDNTSYNQPYGVIENDSNQTNINTSNLPLHLRPENIYANYISETNANMQNYETALGNQMTQYDNEFKARFNSANQQYNNSFTNQNYDSEMVDFWENHIKMGGTPPNTPSPEYTEAYNRVYPGQALPNNNDNDNVNNTIVYNNNNNNNNNDDDRYVKHGNITYAKGTNPNALNNEDGSSGFDAAGLPLNYSDTDNPYYVGAQWAARYGGGLPSYQKLGELNDTQANINIGNSTNPDVLLTGRNFSTNEDIGYSNAMGMPNSTLQKYDGFNLGLDAINLNKSTNAFINSDFLDRGNNVANLDYMGGINVSGDGLRGYAEGRAGIGLGMGNKPYDWIVENSDGTTRNTGMQRTNPLTYANPYLSGVAGLDFNINDTDSVGVQGSLNTPLSPYGEGLGARLNFNKGNFNVNVGTENILNNPQTTFGASYSFKNGGDLPMAKEGIEYNGYTYSKRELKKLANSKDPNQRLLYKQITTKNQKPKVNPVDVNKQRINKEGTSKTINRTSGTEDWTENYMADTPDAIQYRTDRYNAYKEVAGSGAVSEEEYHKLYNRFQNQNRWMNDNYSEDELSGPEWDSQYNYVDGEKDTNDKKGKNWKYKEMIARNEDFTPLTEDEIKIVQGGYIGGKSMNTVGGDGSADYQHTGVGDESLFEGTVSSADGVWGNTTNRQVETNTEVNETEAVPCSNAEELATLCSEAGGTWTPYNAEDGSGCECSEKIIPPPPVKPPETPDADFWLQDRMGIANAMDNKFSLKKYYPWAPEYNLMQIDPVFKDPTREIAAIGEQAVIAANTASTFAGPQRAAAVQAKAQGVAGKQIADAINKVQSDNVTIANTTNVKNAELQYKTQVLNNNEQKQLYDNTMLTEQSYDNALRQANAAITKQLQNAYTNRANTSNLNSIYPNFNIDPNSGGMIDITNAKDFYADPNYVSQQTSVDNYLIERKKLEDSGNFTTEQINEMFPYSSTATKKGKTSGQRNAATITSGYQSDGTSSGKFGKETRRKNLLKKGRALRNWFSPLKGY
tara:strand:+ start:2470 stop:6516 length:4047 start_codon:yes stop_codon:yes gene_type:complete